MSTDNYPVHMIRRTDVIWYG